MRGRKHELIEAVVSRAAAAVLACSVAFSVFALCPAALGSPFAVPVVGGIAAYLLASRLLASMRPESRRFDLPDFSLQSIEAAEADELLLTEQVELVLTDADRLAPPATAADELVLDDILAKLGPQSRVVRLFDPAAMPTPGQLNARIEWHLQGARAVPPAPADPADASQALLQALSELRRSLR